MSLFRLLTWPYVRKHRLRTLLTLTGIVLGVAVFVGMHTVNQSVLHGFRRTVDQIAGATELQITAGDTGFDEETLEKVQSLDSVRVAVPVLEAVADLGIEGQGNLLIVGVDMTGDRSLREYDLEDTEEEAIEDPLVFLAQPDSLLMARPLAERNGWRTGSKLTLDTMNGPRQFTVRGIMRSGGLASGFGGNIAVMDIYAAQQVFGRGRKFDRIDLAVKEGVSKEACRRALEQLLGPGFQVEAPAARGAHFESVSRTFSISITLSSIFALLIGVFIIYNSFSIAVSQRRAEIGILRALGASQWQVRALFLFEGALGGLAGSAAGALCGVLLARALAGYVSGLLGDVYGLTQKAEEITTNPQLIYGAMGLGILASIAGVWVPARNAAAVDPVRALQKGKYQVLSAGENRARRIAALALAAAATLFLLLGRIAALFYVGWVLAVLAALLLTPALALWLARALRPLLRRLRPVEGTLAADGLIQAPRRTSATVAALMLSLALAVGFAGIARASYESIVDWVDSALNPDLFVSTSANFSNRTFLFPAAMAGQIRQIDGVAEVQAIRSARIAFRGSPVLLIAAEIGSLARTARRRPVAGNEEEMYRLASAGQGAIISENLAHLRGLGLGEMLDIPSPSGLLELPVAGIVRDYSDQQGSIMIDRALFLRYWNDGGVNTFRVYLRHGAGESEVKERILRRFSGERRLFVFTNREVRNFILRITNQWLGLTYIQLAVAILVAVLGIVNTLTVSITDRRRELGVLQAVGGTRQQIRHTIWMEAAAIGLIGLLLGLGLGALNLSYFIEMTRRHIAGYLLPYQYPAQFALLLVPLILGASFLAALGPAESAVRASLVQALEYE